MSQESKPRFQWRRFDRKPVTLQDVATKAGIGGIIVNKTSEDIDDRIDSERWLQGYVSNYAAYFTGETSQPNGIDGSQLMTKSKRIYTERMRKQVQTFVKYNGGMEIVKGHLAKADLRAQNVLSVLETVQSAYVSPSVSGIGPAKQMLTEWWFNPIWGQPRLCDLRTLKQLARSHIGSMAVEAILDQIMQIGWDIIPKNLLSPNKGDTSKQIDMVKEFFNNPNRNHDSWDKILRMFMRNILETDDGTLVLVYDEYVSPPIPQTAYAATGEIRAYTAQPAWDAIPAPDAEVIEIFSEDGSSFLKQVDMHGYLMNYWQYSFIVPRRPIRFETSEIIYVMQNPRAGSPYGYSPFESLVDTMKFVIEAFKYNRAFFENSGIPSLHIDFEFIKKPEDLKDLDAWIRTTFVGSDKAYRILTTNGGVNVKTLNFTNKDLQMLELQNFYINIVLAKLKVPAELLGISGGRGMGMSSGSSRGGMGTQSAVMRSRAIKPLISLTEDALNTQLLPKILGLQPSQVLVQFKFGPMSDLDEEERKAKIYQTELSTGLKYINELRIREGEDPVPWGYIPFIPQAGLAHPLEEFIQEAKAAGSPSGGAGGAKTMGEMPQEAKPPPTLGESRAGPIPSSTGSTPKPNVGVGANVPSIVHAGGKPTIPMVGPSGKSISRDYLDKWMNDMITKHKDAFMTKHFFKGKNKLDLRKKGSEAVTQSNLDAAKLLKDILKDAFSHLSTGEDFDKVEATATSKARKVINEWLNRNALVAKRNAAKEMKMPMPNSLSKVDLTQLERNKDKTLKEFHGALANMLVTFKATSMKD